MIAKPSRAGDGHKVLIGIPCLLTGGTEVHTLALVQTLVAARYEVCVCAYFEYEDAVVAQFQKSGARVRLLRLRHRPGGWNLVAFPRLARELHRVLAAERPAVFHVQYLAPGAFPVLCARLSGTKKVVATLHTPGRVYGRGLFLLRWIAKHACTAFICVSTEAERSIFGDAALFEQPAIYSGRRHHTIFNGVETAAIGAASGTAPALPGETGRLETRPVIGVVGRLSPAKGHETLLQAFAKVATVWPSARLLVVGGGESRKALEARARALGIADLVIWTGRVDRAQALDSYRAMDIVVVPSRFEGFGLSAVEAMAAGRPLVASDVDGLRDVVDDGLSGVLVKEGDHQAMAETILRLLASPSLAATLAGNASRRARERFDLSVFRQKWLQLYEAISEQNRPSDSSGNSSGPVPAAI